jgi:hypothetical protein
VHFVSAVVGDLVKQAKEFAISVTRSWMQAQGALSLRVSLLQDIFLGKVVSLGKQFL